MSTTITNEPTLVVGLQMDGGSYHVGSDGVTAIEPYDEVGQNSGLLAYVPWFNVWRGQNLYLKVNGAYVVSVQYKQPDTGEF